MLGGVGRYTVCVNEPPWSSVAERVPKPERIIDARIMELSHLQSLLADEPDSDTVVGLGGGSALDTAKFIAWKTGKPLIQIPSITSVDARVSPTRLACAWTASSIHRPHSAGVRAAGCEPRAIRAATSESSRHRRHSVVSHRSVGLAFRGGSRTRRGVGRACGELGRQLLVELAEHVERSAPSRPMPCAGSRPRISASGRRAAVLRHSRFEEGSEHFLAYAYEHRTGAHPLHGELIAMCVSAMSTLQDNDPDWARDMIERSGVIANPDELDIARDDFVGALLSLESYVESEGLDFSIVNAGSIDPGTAQRLWTAVHSLPHRESNMSAISFPAT